MTRSSIFRNPRLNTSDKTSIHKIDNTPRVYTPSPSTGFFQSGILDSSRPVYTSLDTATDDYGHPIAISAFRFQYDNNGNIRIIDSYRRYYEAHNWDMRSTQEHHNFTSSALKSLREQQHATYSRQYDAGETASLQRYLGKSVIVGYGVHQFDFNNLFPYTSLPNSTIDLRAAARNIWPDKNSKLKNVFPRILGNTMEQKGLLPSNPDASSLANIMLLDKMYKYPGEAGEAIRYVMSTPEGRQLVEKDPYLKHSTMVVKGTYKAQFDRHRLSEVYMTEAELKAAREEMAGYLNGIENNGGVGEEVIPLTKYETEDGDISPAALEALAWMKTQQKRQGQESLKKKVKVKVKTGQSSPWINNSTAGQELFQEFNQFNNYRRLGLVRQLAGMGELEGDALLEAAGYTTKAEGYTTLKGMAAKLRKAKEDQELKDFRETVEQGNWKSLARDLSSGEYSEKYGGWATDVKKYTPWTDKESPYTGSDFDRDEALRKMRYLDKAQRAGHISAEQRISLDSLTGSYEDLVDATNDAIEANERLAKVYQTMANIKPYDINQYIHAAHSQWSGITGAAHGVIPNFVLNPARRIGDAMLNYVDRSVAPWNAVQRVWNSGIGNALTGVGTAAGAALGGPVGAFIGAGGAGAITGTVNAVTQVVGNTEQARLEMFGLNLQNNLNTLGAMISWISTPFQILHKAAKLLIGSFTGLSLKLNSFMGSGIGMMSQMGNPLTALTGMDYGAYIRSTLKDSASLLRKGTMNSTIEDFAQQQQMFYTMGQVDTDRLIAASLLGVYSDVYNPTTDAEGAYNSMANKALRDLKTADPRQRARIMGLARKIDPNLPQLLTSAELMGISDVSILDNPNAIINRANGRRQGGVFYNPLQQWEASNFRWTQWEYGAAKEQMGFSKMRIADRMWTAGGKSIYNAANRLFDGVAEAIDTGDWSRVVKEATYIWDKAREAFTNAWEGIKSAVKGDEGENGQGNSIVNTFKSIGALLENIIIKGALKILNVWDNLMVQLADRLQGAIAYLSTIQVKPYIEDGKLKFNISTIKDRMEYSDADKLYSENSALGGVGAMVLDKPNEGMQGLIRLGEAMGIKGHGGSALNPAYNPSIGDIKAKLRSLREQGYQYIPYEYLKASGTPITQIGLDDESIDAFIRNLKGTEGADTSWEKAAVAFATPLREGMVYNKKEAYDKTGIGGFARQWVGDVEDVVGTLASAAVGDNYARVDLWFKNDTGKRAMIGADSKGSVFSKDIVLLQQMVPDGLKLVVDQIK